jgi:hypothetical protein
MAESNLAEKNETNLAIGAVSFEDDVSAGFEESDKDSFAIPFLRILQKLSPQLEETDGAYMPEAKAGMLINSVTEDLFSGSEGMTVIPCHYRRTFIEWQTREKGGGFVAEYEPFTGSQIPTTKDEKKRNITSSGTQIVDTRCHYVLIVQEDGTTMPAVITMASTQTKKSKKWMTVMQNLLRQRRDGTLYNPAMFASIFKVNTVTESNDQGNWYGWKITHLQFLDENNPEHQRLYQTARAFRDAVKSGAAVIDHAVDDVSEPSNTDVPFDEKMPRNNDIDEDDIGF